MRRWPVEGERVDGRAVLAWNRRLAGTNDVVLRIKNNTLVAYVDGESNLHGGCKARHGVQALPSKAWSKNRKLHLSLHRKPLPSLQPPPPRQHRSP